MHWQDHSGGVGADSNSSVNTNPRTNSSCCGCRRFGTDTLSHRQISIVDEEYAVSKDGMEMFGVLDLAAGFEGCRLHADCPIMPIPPYYPSHSSIRR
jgi:hypothetical protein